MFFVDSEFIRFKRCMQKRQSNMCAYKPIKMKNREMDFLCVYHLINDDIKI